MIDFFRLEDKPATTDFFPDECSPIALTERTFPRECASAHAYEISDIATAASHSMSLSLAVRSSRARAASAFSRRHFTVGRSLSTNSYGHSSKAHQATRLERVSRVFFSSGSSPTSAGGSDIPDGGCEGGVCSISSRYRARTSPDGKQQYGPQSSAATAPPPPRIDDSLLASLAKLGPVHVPDHVSSSSSTPAPSSSSSSSSPCPTSAVPSPHGEGEGVTSSSQSADNIYRLVEELRSSARRLDAKGNRQAVVSVDRQGLLKANRPTMMQSLQQLPHKSPLTPLAEELNIRILVA